jgi:hypothetical protein
MTVKLPVTESGVTLPKAWFGDATEVEVRQENGHVSVEPLGTTKDTSTGIQPYAANDPIWQLGTKTSDLPITDASVNLDKYLYGEVGDS